MNLFEIADEFENPKMTPEEDLAFLEKREKALIYQIGIIRKQRENLEGQIVGSKKFAQANCRFLGDPTHAAEIQKVVDSGYIAVTIPQMDSDWRNAPPGEIVEYFIPKVPQNEELWPKLKRVLQREAVVDKLRRNIPTEVKRAKTRLSAWRRKQPDYVGRKTGKELLKEIRQKVEDHIHAMNWPVTISNAYYWLANKMIVVDMPVRHGIGSNTPYETAKTIIKPELVKFIESLGYTQFRVVDRYDQDSKIVTVKLQLDDLEAKNKIQGPAKEGG